MVSPDRKEAPRQSIKESLSTSLTVAALPVALFAATRPMNVGAEYKGKERFKCTIFDRGASVGHFVTRKSFRYRLLEGGQTFVGRVGSKALIVLDCEEGFDHDGHAVAQVGVEAVRKVHKRGRKKGKVYFKMRGREEPVVLEHGKPTEVLKDLVLTYLDPKKPAPGQGKSHS